MATDDPSPDLGEAKLEALIALLDLLPTAAAAESTQRVLSVENRY